MQRAIFVVLYLIHGTKLMGLHWGLTLSNIVLLAIFIAMWPCLYTWAPTCTPLMSAHEHCKLIAGLRHHTSQGH
jgi:hypothetical protein